MKVLSTLTLMFLLCLASFAFGKSKPLADNQLDQISAGSAVATNNSSASDDTEASVDLKGSSLSNATSSNIVNASDSTVGNASNVWSGKSLNNVDKLSQANFVSQKAVPCACTQADFENDHVSTNANAIAVNNAEADNTASFSVSLSGSAESDASALNIVNAAGSVVGSGINAASATNMNNLGSLTQLNVITQLGH